MGICGKVADMAIEVGDWVRYAGEPMKVEQVMGVMLRARTLEVESRTVASGHCEPWVPRVGEWVRYTAELHRGSHSLNFPPEPRRVRSISDDIAMLEGPGGWLGSPLTLEPCAAPEAGAAPEPPPKPDLVELLEEYEAAQREFERADLEWHEAGEAMSKARAALVAAMEGRP